MPHLVQCAYTTVFERNLQHCKPISKYLIMKAVTISEPGATPHVNTDIDTPIPGEGQILVKLTYTAINPVYVFHWNMILPSTSFQSAPCLLTNSTTPATQ